MTNLKVFDAKTALTNFEAFEKMSETFVKSGAFPKNMNAPKFVVLMQAGYDLGLAPTEAIRSLAVINGNVSMFGTKVIERVKAYGYKIDLEEELKEEIYKKDTKKYKRFVGHCKATLSKGDDSWTETYTMDDAKVAGLLSKDNWTKYPKLMLRYRAIGQCVKFFCPEVLGGVSMYEEMKDHFEEEKTKERAFEKISDEDILDGFETNLGKEKEEKQQKEEQKEEKEEKEDKKKKKQEKEEEKQNKLINEKEDKPKDYVSGQRVRHKLFGDGKIEDVVLKKSLVQFDKGMLKSVENKMLELI